MSTTNPSATRPSFTVWASRLSSSTSRTLIVTSLRSGPFSSPFPGETECRLSGSTRPTRATPPDDRRSGSAQGCRRRLTSEPSHGLRLRCGGRRDPASASPRGWAPPTSRRDSVPARRPAVQEDLSLRRWLLLGATALLGFLLLMVLVLHGGEPSRLDRLTSTVARWSRTAGRTGVARVAA